jgi:hypothetical protein
VRSPRLGPHAGFADVRGADQRRADAGPPEFEAKGVAEAPQAELGGVVDRVSETGYLAPNDAMSTTWPERRCRWRAMTGPSPDEAPVKSAVRPESSSMLESAERALLAVDSQRDLRVHQLQCHSFMGPVIGNVW